MSVSCKKLKTLLAVLVFFLLTCTVSSVSAEVKTAPNKIPYPADYNTSDGASGVEGRGDHKKTPYFAHPGIYNLKSGGSLTILEKFKTYQQTTEWSCGNASALMVANYFGLEGQRELDIARIMGTNSEIGGTTTEQMTRYFKSIGYEVRSSLEVSEEDMIPDGAAFKDWVIKHLTNRRPIMVEWLDWHAHWQVVIGYDTMGTDDVIEDDVLILADPYDVGDQLQDGYYIFPAERFFYMWHDIRYEGEDRLRNQQWVISYPSKR
ncbi:hypothetical protein FACS1894216_21410 [Synergistales bacterium]|nr:hypothetical protein FACS1894216_21410 [Synergistales bacterium]